MWVILAEKEGFARRHWGSAAAQPGELKNHSLDGFFPPQAGRSLLIPPSFMQHEKETANAISFSWRRRRDSPGGTGAVPPPARGTKKPFTGWFFTRHRRAVPFSSLPLLCSTKKRPQMRSLFRGGEGGIRTLAPVTPAYSLSRGAPYSHLGTSPRIYCRRYVELSGGERGIRTPGALRHHWFSRPAP